MGRDRDARDNRFDITPVVQKRCQRGPALFVHPIAFIEDAHRSGQDRRHERGGMIGNGPGLRQDRSYQQIFRSRIGGALENMNSLLTLTGSGHRQRRLTNSRWAGEPRRKWEVLMVDDQPAGQQLLEDFPFANPFLGGRNRLPQANRHVIDYDRPGTRPGLRVAHS
jgi:hypothetical protein